MFNEHKITYENSQSVLYLFTQSFDTNLNLIKGIFSNLHEDVLLDWTDDYLDLHDIPFAGELVRIVAGSTIVRDFPFPFYMKKEYEPKRNGKILKFPLVKKKNG